MHEDGCKCKQCREEEEIGLDYLFPNDEDKDEAIRREWEKSLDR